MKVNLHLVFNPNMYRGGLTLILTAMEFKEPHFEKRK
jgi:hypothetical protein